MIILLISFTRSQSWLTGTSGNHNVVLVPPFSPSLKVDPRCFASTHHKQDITKLHSTLNNEVGESIAKATRKKSSASSVAEDGTHIAENGSPKEQRKKIEMSTSSPSTYSIQQQEDDDIDGDSMNHAFNIPTTGVSLADSMKKKEEFITTLTAILDVGTNGEKELEIIYNDEGSPIGVKKEKERTQHEGVARIDTVSTEGNMGEEPVRWLVSMKDPNGDEDKCSPYFMIDIPPYSDQLADKIKSFMDPSYNNTKDASSQSRGKLNAILVTNQECIHYDQSPGVYVTRTSDLTKWKKAFPDVKVIIYRLDQPRECRESVSQVLDGYGPWGWDEDSDVGFVETGRPLRIEEWDETTASNVLKRGELPPDDDDESHDDEDFIVADDREDQESYSKEAIRKREESYHLLAVYTPGHTFGSVTYVFPKRGICCSGYALPLETASGSLNGFYDEEDDGETYSASTASQGPRLDYQGYLATSVSRPRQMSSASNLINDYIDRFKVVLPSRGDVVFLDGDTDTRKRDLTENVGMYRKISEIYGKLGIPE